MADKPEFSKSFLIPQEAREKAQQWVNAGGSPSQLNSVLDYIEDLTLTDKQREELLNALPQESRGGVDYINKERERTYQRYLDKGMSSEDAKKKQAGSKIERQRIKQLDKELISRNLQNEFHDKTSFQFDEAGRQTRRPPDIKHYDPQAVFGANPKAGALTKLDSALQSLKKYNAEQKAGQAAADKAAAIRKMGLKIVPKLGAVLGGPIGMGIAAGSALMDASDAYAMADDTINPKTESDQARQKMLADLMRKNEIY